MRNQKLRQRGNSQNNLGIHKRAALLDPLLCSVAQQAKKAVALFIILLLFPTNSFTQNSVIEWKSVTKGVEYYTKKSRSCSYTITKIDLSTVKPVSYYGKPISVKKFSKKNNCIVAFNTTPYNKKRRAVGIVAYSGECLSAPNDKYDAALIDSSGISFIAQSKRFINLTSSIPCAAINNGDNGRESIIMGGFWITKKDGVDRVFKEHKDARLAIAYSDKLMIYILSGKRLTYKMCNDIFSELGCTNVLQFDGGHSTSLIIAGRQRINIFLRRRVPVILGFTTP